MWFCTYEHGEDHNTYLVLMRQNDIIYIMAFLFWAAARFSKARPREPAEVDFRAKIAHKLIPTGPVVCTKFLESSLVFLCFLIIHVIQSSTL